MILSTLYSSANRTLRTLLISGAIVLAGCSSTGNRFDTTDLRFLIPGETTLQDATLWLQGEPTNVYRQLDGSATARWSHTATLATDAVYFNQELWLAFDSYGRFVRIVKSNNIPHANLYQDGRRVDVPAARLSPPAGMSSQADMPTHPGSAASEQPAPFSHTVVSYPLTN